MKIELVDAEAARFWKALGVMEHYFRFDQTPTQPDPAQCLVREYMDVRAKLREVLQILESNK